MPTDSTGDNPTQNPGANHEGFLAQPRVLDDQAGSFNPPPMQALKKKWTWAQLCLLICALDTGRAGAQATEGRERFLIESKFKFAPSNAGILLPVSIKGREYPFLLDTGSSRMI